MADLLMDSLQLDQFPEFDSSYVDPLDPFDNLDLDLVNFDFDLDFDLPAEESPPPPPTSGDVTGDASGVSSSSSAAAADHQSPASPDSDNSTSTRRDVKRKSRDLDGEEEKKRARLMRNRESAQLSRERKKQYVEELKEKVRSMSATINDLNARVSFFTAENAALRQQLGANAGLPVPVPLPQPMYHWPWPAPAYGMRPSLTPVVPIPRLKTTQPTAPPAKKKAKTKKVASVSLLGLLVLMLFCGAFVPAVHRGFNGNGGSGEVAMLGDGNSEKLGRLPGRVLGVDGVLNGSNSTLFEDGIDGSSAVNNSRETLPALLYLPRNGRHVKVNGNLVINSVLASERAVASLKKEDTSLAVPVRQAASEALQSYESMKEHLLALAPGGDVNALAGDLKSSVSEDALPQWFSEGMAGPILSSGMCTEVFQFEVSPTSAHGNGLVPFSSTVRSTSLVNATSTTSLNSTDELPTSSHSPRKKNRRALYGNPIPLPEARRNKTARLEEPTRNDDYGSNKPISSMVVSVLADPREAGDGESEGRISSKSLSRVFVVVLVDSVKYVTYSCVLPFKDPSPHL